jgi:Skp family chaperone for outer membrane proteins
VDWVQQAIGPLGALAIAVPTAALALREVKQRYQAEVDRLKEEHKAKCAELDATRKALADETAARLADAKASSAALLAVYDRVHATLDGLEDWVRTQLGKQPESQR